MGEWKDSNVLITLSHQAEQIGTQCLREAESKRRSELRHRRVHSV